MSTLPIIVYGDGALFREYFNAIVAFFGTSDFSTLLNISACLAIVTVCYSYITKRTLMVLIKWLGLYYLGVYILFTPKTSVVIIDRVNGSMEYAVDNVPFGLAILASYTSAIDDALTQALEDNFTMPDYMPYHQTGMVFASRLVSMANQFEINDSVFDENLQEFIHQCVFYDILLNKYSANDLLSASNVWSFVTSNASPARAFVYNGTILTCHDGAAKLSDDWKNVIDASIQQYSQRIYPNLTSDKAKTQMLMDLPISYNYLTNVSAAAQDIMQQNLMANAIQRGVVKMGAKLDASAALESYSFARAQEQKRLTNITVGDMAANWLPLMQIAMQLIIYSSFIFIVLLSIFPFGGMIVRNYIYSVIWVHTWAPLYAVLNLMISYNAQSSSTAAANGAISLKSMSGILQINSDIAGLAGYLSLLVPMFASGIVFGMHKILSQGVQYDSGVTQSAAGSAVNEAVTGNLSFGNTSLGNHNAFNTSSNHLDTSGRASSGMMTSQLAGGSFISTAADGSHIMDMRNSLSSLGASINLSEGLRNSYSLQADRAESAATSEGFSYSQASNAAIRNMYDLSHHLGVSSSSGDSWSVSSNAAAARAINENTRLTQDYADRHGMSFHDAANVLANEYVESKLSGGVSVGTPPGMPISAQGGISGSGGVSRSAGHTSGVDKNSSYSDAQSFIHDTGYAKNVDLVARAAKEHSLRFNNEEGNRLVDSMGASFDKADTARHDMQSHYQEAATARQNASYVEEHAASIQVNGTQQYQEWIENQPGTNGTGRLGTRTIESINKDAALSQLYSQQFIEQYKSQIVSGWNHGMASTGEGIHRQFQSHNKSVPSATSIEAIQSANQNNLTTQASEKGLHANHLVDTSAKQDAEKMIADNSHHVSAVQENVSAQGQHQQSIVQREENRHRHGGLTRDLTHDIDTKNYSE